MRRFMQNSRERMRSKDTSASSATARSATLTDSLTAITVPARLASLGTSKKQSLPKTAPFYARKGNAGRLSTYMMSRLLLERIGSWGGAMRGRWGLLRWSLRGRFAVAVRSLFGRIRNLASAIFVGSNQKPIDRLIANDEIYSDCSKRALL